MYKHKQKDPWQLVAAKYCVENSEKGFTKKEMEDYINALYKVDPRQLEFFFQEEIYAPAGRKFPREYNPNDNRWIPPLDLVSKVTDYEELKEARKNSRQAFWLSIIAILISLLTLILGFYQNHI